MNIELPVSANKQGASFYSITVSGYGSELYTSYFSTQELAQARGDEIVAKGPELHYLLANETMYLS